MTLVAAYERLIGARGQVVNDAMFATAPAAADDQAAKSSTADATVGPHIDTKQSIDDSPKIESEPARDRKTAAAEHCTTYLYRGHRRRLCSSDAAEPRPRERHAVRSGGRRISRQGRGARHHG
jgi:hypothetical protein